MSHACFLFDCLIVCLFVCLLIVDLSYCLYLFVSFYTYLSDGLFVCLFVCLFGALLSFWTSGCRLELFFTILSVCSLVSLSVLI